MWSSAMPVRTQSSALCRCVGGQELADRRRGRVIRRVGGGDRSRTVLDCPSALRRPFGLAGDDDAIRSRGGRSVRERGRSELALAVELFGVIDRPGSRGACELHRESLRRGNADAERLRLLGRNDGRQSNGELGACDVRETFLPVDDVGRPLAVARGQLNTRYPHRGSLRRVCAEDYA